MLDVKSLSFAYEKKPVLEDLSFSVAAGQHVAVMGESGCGKSTLLKLIYGLLTPREGRILWGDQEVKGPLHQLVPGESYMKYLAQDFDLMPHTSVAENISQYLSVFYPETLKQRTAELLEMTDMESFADTKVKFLSGGQQQRVALARVLAQKPELLLLDEPFSHIDNFRKNSLRRNLFDYLKREGITCITATHDYNDVLPFADRVLILREKELIADEAILELYNNPKDIYIASLFGEANVVPINVIKSYADTKRRIIVYAHEFKISKNSGLPITVKKTYPMGSHFLVKGVSDGHIIHFNSPQPLEAGKELYLNMALDVINRRINH